MRDVFFVLFCFIFSQFSIYLIQNALFLGIHFLIQFTFTSLKKCEHSIQKNTESQKHKANAVSQGKIDSKVNISVITL